MLIEENIVKHENAKNKENIISDVFLHLFSTIFWYFLLRDNPLIF